MAVSSLKFRIEGENSSALRSIADVKREAKGLGDELQKSIGDKLKGVFSVVAVEEMVRRTGEWATELQKTARALGMTGEQYQALAVMAERAGVSVDKIHNYYNKLEAAATKAANGNVKLAQSFHALKINPSDLTGPNRLNTSELFYKTLAGGGNGNEGALQSIYGAKAYLDIRALGKEANGRNGPQYQAAHESQIVSEADSLAMTRGMMLIKEDLKSIVNHLATPIHLVLSIVDGFAKMVNGLVAVATAAIRNPFLGIKAIFGGQAEKDAWKQDTAQGKTRIKSMYKGIGNFLPGLVSFGNWQPFGRPETEAEREGAGAGEGLGTLATFGVSPWAKAAGLGARGIESAAGVVGAETLAGKAGAAAANFSGIGGTGLSGIASRVGALGVSTIRSALKTMSIPEILNWVKTGSGGNKMLQNMFVKMSPREIIAWARGIDKYTGPMGIAGAGYSAAGIGAADIAGSDLFSGGLGPPPTRQGILSRLGEGGTGGGSGSKNLAIGGVFGADIQSKIIQLNSKMVELLQQIVENTTPDIDSGGESEGAGL
jgi:hypothetical protein